MCLPSDSVVRIAHDSKLETGFCITATFAIQQGLHTARKLLPKLMPLLCAAAVSYMQPTGIVGDAVEHAANCIPAHVHQVNAN